MSSKHEDSWQSKVFGTLPERNILQDRGALLMVREYTAMHEENFLSSWVREDMEGIEEGRTDEGQREGKHKW